MAHYDGDEYCGPTCLGPHIDEEAEARLPECCPRCGGNALACFRAGGCNEGGRSEPGDGLTGAEEFYDHDQYEY